MSLTVQMGTLLSTGPNSSFALMSQKKDLSRLLKNKEKVYVDFFAFKNETVVCKDHGDKLEGCSKREYVVNLALLHFKGLVRSLMADIQGRKDEMALLNLLRKASNQDPDFKEGTLSARQAVHLFEEKVFSSANFRRNFEEGLEKMVGGRQGAKNLEEVLSSMWKENSLSDSSAYLLKILVVELAIPANIYLSTDTSKTDILDYRKLFHCQPKVIVIVSATGHQVWASFGLPHSTQPRELETEKKEYNPVGSDKRSGGSPPDLFYESAGSSTIPAQPYRGPTEGLVESQSSQVVKSVTESRGFIDRIANYFGAGDPQGSVAQLEADSYKSSHAEQPVAPNKQHMDYLAPPEPQRSRRSEQQSNSNASESTTNGAGLQEIRNRRNRREEPEFQDHQPPNFTPHYFSSDGSVNPSERDPKEQNQSFNTYASENNEPGFFSKLFGFGNNNSEASQDQIYKDSFTFKGSAQ